MKKELFSNVFSLIWNLFIIYVCYSLCRLTFLLENFRLFSENFDRRICAEYVRSRYYFRYDGHFV